MTRTEGRRNKETLKHAVTRTWSLDKGDETDLLNI
jgi:hypothetical protein